MGFAQKNRRYSTKKLVLYKRTKAITERETHRGIESLTRRDNTRKQTQAQIEKKDITLVKQEQRQKRIDEGYGFFVNTNKSKNGEETQMNQIRGLNLETNTWTDRRK